MQQLAAVVTLATRCRTNGVALFIYNRENLVAVVFFHEVAVLVSAKLCLLINNTRAKWKFYRHGRQKGGILFGVSSFEILA